MTCCPLVFRGRCLAAAQITQKTGDDEWRLSAAVACLYFLRTGIEGARVRIDARPSPILWPLSLFAAPMSTDGQRGVELG